MYYVYAIYNAFARKFYIGQTQDLLERLRLHNDKSFKGFTSRFNGKWSIIFSEKCKSRKDALVREKQLKSYRGREFIKNHIPG